MREDAKRRKRWRRCFCLSVAQAFLTLRTRPVPQVKTRRVTPILGSIVLAFFFALAVSSVGARHAVPERATRTPAPSSPQRASTFCSLLRRSHRDKWRNRAKFVRRTRHAVPERATRTPAPSSPQRASTFCSLLRRSHRDEWHDRAKFVRRARHAVPLLQIATAPA